MYLIFIALHAALLAARHCTTTRFYHKSIFAKWSKFWHHEVGDDEWPSKPLFRLKFKFKFTAYYIIAVLQFLCMASAIILQGLYAFWGMRGLSYWLQAGAIAVVYVIAYNIMLEKVLLKKNKGL